jgi:hypothetical protein
MVARSLMAKPCVVNAVMRVQSPSSTPLNRALAQRNKRASVFETQDKGSIPLGPIQWIYFPVAQMEEHRSSNPEVESSNLSGDTNLPRGVTGNALDFESGEERSSRSEAALSRGVVGRMLGSEPSGERSIRSGTVLYFNSRFAKWEGFGLQPRY